MWPKLTRDLWSATKYEAFQNVRIIQKLQSPNQGEIIIRFMIHSHFLSFLSRTNVKWQWVLNCVKIHTTIFKTFNLLSFEIFILLWNYTKTRYIILLYLSQNFHSSNKQRLCEIWLKIANYDWEIFKCTDILCQ